ncbi:pyridine nucleotide-disulfide oxidoreductase [Deinococcus sedimenti]|uniref:Pyridine nucleotide-disulfide oxidoreductase n=1 Tax=Deinococcus sedimenti TaxID=1867090 RepID=A0ABQ2SA03_9DEIO|nr:pyridine nucleotide-disulfide oxidoreductase [Deinococcus sedimenti]
MIVIGAGSAGLNAALVLGRARRHTLLLDHGLPRNAPAHASHGLLTRDGTPPLELTRLAREQLAPYPVTLHTDAAETAEAHPGHFTVTLGGGQTVHARRLLLATGVTDQLPDLPGLREGWGTTVHHCPYCHGWEVRDQHLADLIPGGGNLAYHRSVLLRQWTPHLTLLTHGPAHLTGEQRSTLAHLGVPIIERPVTGWTGRAVTFQDGSHLDRDALFITPGQAQRSRLPDQLGCARTDHGPLAGVLLAVTAATGQTSVPGVYAAGDMIGEQQVVLAAASGARAAAALNAALCTEDAARPAS